MELLTLAFSLLAALSASIAAGWMWLDRPHRSWRITVSRDLLKTTKNGNVEKLGIGSKEDSHVATITLCATGTAILHDVDVRVCGADFTHIDVESSVDRMVPGGEPIRVDVDIPEASNGEAYLEVIWRRNRPRRMDGERMNLRSLSWSDWRWKWSSLRWVRQPGQPLHKGRWSRTKGLWVERYRPPRVPIPSCFTEDHHQSK